MATSGPNVTIATSMTFAIQDEISRAIVAALKVKLLPEEKKAIERRGTENVDAYNLYLLARQIYTIGFEGDRRRTETIIRFCQRAVEIDQNYAEAWALIAMAEMALRSHFGGSGDGALAAAQRALELNPLLAEAHAVKARMFSEEGRHEEGSREIETAIRLDAESHQVNKVAALLRFRQQRMEDAVRYYEKAVALEEGDYSSASMLITCHIALRNREAARRAAEVALARAENALAHDSNNCGAMGHGSVALAVLGQGERAKDWMNRAVLIDPENITTRYNFACALANHLGDKESALEMLGPAFEKTGTYLVKHAKVDPDFDCIRDDPRFQEMLAAAERRLGTQTNRE
jgi:adenylate cyclase